MKYQTMSTRYTKKYLILILLTVAPFFNAASLAEESLFAPRHEKVEMGETKISQYYSAELSGGIIRARMLRIFHHDKGKKTLIGLTKFSEHASRQNGYAISEDGKTILYFHQNLPDASDIDKPSGLYQSRHGEEDKYLERQVSNTAFLPGKVPRNTIVFTKLIKKPTTLIVEGKVYIRDTDGNERLVWQ